MGNGKLQITTVLSSPLVELVVKNPSAHRLALEWSFFFFFFLFLIEV